MSTRAFLLETVLTGCAASAAAPSILPVGGGRILVPSFDLRSNLNHRPVVRQRRQALVRDAGSAKFAPAQEMDVAFRQRLAESTEVR